MPHPDGGSGEYLNPVHTFKQAYDYVGEEEIELNLLSGEKFTAKRGMAGDGVTKTIVFFGRFSSRGNVCPACWGYRTNCNRNSNSEYAMAIEQAMTTYYGKKWLAGKLDYREKRKLNELIAGSSIKSSFEVVFKVYENTDRLMLDLENEVADRGFVRVNEATGASLSCSYNRPGKWLTTFLCRYWTEKIGRVTVKQGPLLYFLGASIIFANREKGIEPLFSYGVLQSMEEERAVFYHEWLLYVVQNIKNNFTYSRDGKNCEFVELPSDKCVTSFYCKLPDKRYKWPKRGLVVAFPLTDIQYNQDLASIADGMKILWQERDLLDASSE